MPVLLGLADKYINQQVQDYGVSSGRSLWPAPAALRGALSGGLPVAQGGRQGGRAVGGKDHLIFLYSNPTRCWMCLHALRGRSRYWPAPPAGSYRFLAHGTYGSNSPWSPTVNGQPLTPGTPPSMLSPSAISQPATADGAWLTQHG